MESGPPRCNRDLCTPLDCWPAGELETKPAGVAGPLIGGCCRLRKSKQAERQDAKARDDEGRPRRRHKQERKGWEEEGAPVWWPEWPLSKWAPWNTDWLQRTRSATHQHKHSPRERAITIERRGPFLFLLVEWLALGLRRRAFSLLGPRLSSFVFPLNLAGAATNHFIIKTAAQSQNTSQGHEIRECRPEWGCARSLASRLAGRQEGGEQGSPGTQSAELYASILGHNNHQSTQLLMSLNQRSRQLAELARAPTTTMLARDCSVKTTTMTGKRNKWTE